MAFRKPDFLIWGPFIIQKNEGITNLCERRGFLALINIRWRVDPSINTYLGRMISLFRSYTIQQRWRSRLLRLRLRLLSLRKESTPINGCSDPAMQKLRTLNMQSHTNRPVPLVA